MWRAKIILKSTNVSQSYSKKMRLVFLRHDVTMYMDYSACKQSKTLYTGADMQRTKSPDSVTEFCR